MQIIIEDMTMNDNLAIGNLIKNELGYADIDFKKLNGRLNRMKTDKNYSTFVASYEGVVVGFIGLCRGIAFELDGEFIRIIALSIKSDYQHEGIGTQLIRHAEKYAIDNGIHFISLNSGLQRLGAHKFYEQNGYIKKGYSFKKDI